VGVCDSYQDAVDLLLLPPAQVFVEVAYCLLDVEVVARKESCKMSSIEHQLLDFVEHFAFVDFSDEGVECAYLFLVEPRYNAIDRNKSRPLWGKATWSNKYFKESSRCGSETSYDCTYLIF
jgi:hypothetical protein